MTRASRIAGLAASAALLAGCSLLPDASRTQPQSPSSTSSADDLGTLTGAGRPLTQEELQAALPSPQELGGEWAEDPQETVFEVKASDVSPSTCSPLVLKGPGWDTARESQRGRAQDNYVDGDSQVGSGEFMVVWAYSLDDPLPADLFDEAGSLIGECASMDITQADTGSVSTYQTTQLPFPNLGDRTLALRMKIQQTISTLTMDFVVVKVGHNTVTVANSSYGGEPDTDATERAMRTALKHLEEGS